MWAMISIPSVDGTGQDTTLRSSAATFFDSVGFGFRGRLVNLLHRDVFFLEMGIGCVGVMVVLRSEDTAGSGKSSTQVNCGVVGNDGAVTTPSAVERVK